MTSPEICIDTFEQPRSERRLARFLSPAPVFYLDACSDEGRDEVESYISTHFAKIHQASIRKFMPLLFSIKCNGQHSAAAGVRSGRHTPFFLEQYLDGSIENLISERMGTTIKRERIAEIGNMVATGRGSSQLLFLILGAALQHSQHDWVTFTATTTVRKGITQLGFKLHKLADANPALLPAGERQRWGSYYQENPQIVALNLTTAMDFLSTRKIYSSMVGLFHKRIIELAHGIDRG